MSDGFLSRWSRKKRDEARQPPEVAPEVLPAVEPAADEGSLTPEELAQLPSLDALTAATDLAPFLRAGVPRVLRNAALRRMWSIDPAIRDFVSEAREYAYDWNTPGGVPGTGGAISAEDVRAMVEKVFGNGEEKPSTASAESDMTGEGFGDPVVSDASPDGESEGALSEETPPAASPHLPVDPVGIDAPPRVTLGEGGETLAPPAGRGDAHQLSAFASPAKDIAHLAPDHPESTPEPPTPTRLRRHGGALPI